jgi:GNAT superfamily N-acetyltransferase
MAQLRVRPTTAAEFKSYRDRAISDRAAQHVQAGTSHQDQAKALAAREFDDALPAGLQTEEMLFLTGENVDGEYVGQIWIALNQGVPGAAWIVEFEISPEHQDNEYAYALAEAAEELARQQGADTIAGHLNAANEVLLHAVEAAGYQVTAVIVRKPLRGQAAEI